MEEARRITEKWDESSSRARATRKKEGQRALQPFPTRFSRTGSASVVVTASESDLSTLVTTLQTPRKQPKGHQGVTKGNIF